MTKPQNTYLGKAFTYITFTAFALEAVLILFSWIINATDIGLNVRSLLSTEGIRWFFGSFIEGLSSPLLAWIVLLAVGCGAVNKSGLSRALYSTLKGKKIPYRIRVATFTSMGTIVVMTVLYLLMALVPHAVLLSVTGGLMPSPFSASLIPAVAFIMTLAACIYGLQSGNIETSYEMFSILEYGIVKAAPLFPLYIAVITLWRSACYVFMM